MAKNVKFQSINVPYPDKLYAVAIWIHKERLFLLFLNRMFKDLLTLKKYSSKAIKIIRKEKKMINSVLDTVLVLQVTFVKVHPLQKDLWKTTSIKLDRIQREFLFLEATDKPPLYNIMVTPTIKARKGKYKFEYTAAFPFIKSQINEIDKLMRASDIFVSPEAKTCSIYKIDMVFGFDLINNKVVDSKNKKESYTN